MLHKRQSCFNNSFAIIGNTYQPTIVYHTFSMIVKYRGYCFLFVYVKPNCIISRLRRGFQGWPKYGPPAFTSKQRKVPWCIWWTRRASGRISRRISCAWNATLRWTCCTRTAGTVPCTWTCATIYCRTSRAKFPKPVPSGNCTTPSSYKSTFTVLSGNQPHDGIHLKKKNK